MELTHRFTVPASKQVTWAAFNDVESVAGCFPGATVTGVRGEEFSGTCKVKLGPIALTYAGSGRFLEKDEAAGRFVMEAKGKDKRGNGTAGATVTMTMSDAGSGGTEVEVLTDLSITGKPAQFGRGVIQDVSDKLLGQFMTCLEQRLGSGGPAAGDGEGGYAGAAPGAGVATGLLGGDVGKAPAGAAATGSDTPLAAASAAAVTGTAGARTAGAEATRGGSSGGSWRAEAGGEPDDALDLGATVLPILVRTYWRQLVGAVLVLILLRRLFGGRRG